METNKILHGDCLERLKELPDNSVDSVITDPPYGLSFMGKKWDYDVPSVDVWKECLRVLKPGGHLLSFAGSRTYHRMAINIEDAGFEIRDQIMWIYGSGFPKSLNIGKSIDKMQGNEREVIGFKDNEKDFRDLGVKTKEIHGLDKLGVGINCERKQLEISKGNTEWEGWGTALKPAHEPIVVARKPLAEKNVTLNVLKYGTGGINIDKCRIRYTGKTDSRTFSGSWKTDKMADNVYEGGYEGINQEVSQQGRFPANIILECICDKTKEGKIIGNGHFNSKVNMKGHTLYEGGFKDFEQEDKILKEKSIIHTNPNCPCFIMDLQSGSAGAFAPVKKAQRPNNIYNNYEYFGDNGKTFRNDKGGASRFFYCAKASKSERELGLSNLSPANENLQGLDTRGRTIEREDGSKTLVERWQPDAKRVNNHPTVKPVKLMEYLIKLVTPDGGVVLDPFIGSGTTAIACLKLNKSFVGIERDDEYIKIAEARIKPFLNQTKLGDNND